MGRDMEAVICDSATTSTAPSSAMKSLIISSICVLIITLPAAVVAMEAKGLYGANDQITILHSLNFNSTVYDKEKAFFVEFYSSWCGHCINYAPTWKTFAKDVAGWKPIVDVAAINCAEEVNREICMYHSIQAFPTLKYFPFQAEHGSQGVPFEKARGDPTALRKGLVESLLNDPAGLSSIKWPNLNPLTENTLPLFGGSTEKIRVIVAEDTETEPLGYGVQATLDLFYIKSSVTVRRAPLRLASVYGVANAPGIVLFKQGSVDPSYVSSSKLSYFEIIHTTADHFKLPKPPFHHQTGTADAETPSETTPATDLNARSYVESRPHVKDLASGVGYMLHHEVSSGKELAGERLEGVKGMVNLLHKYLPATAGMRAWLGDMNRWLQVQHSPLSTQTYLDHFEDLQKHGRPFPIVPDWEHCQGSALQYRGYPCSLWTMFHTITLSAYKIYGDAADSLGILSAIRNYIINMFGCRSCGLNFEKESRHLKEQVKPGVHVVVWLWATHNRVNNRLKGQKTEDPNFPKLQFPPQQLCSKCRNHRGIWDESEVVKFLQQFYLTDMGTDSQTLEYHRRSFANGQRVDSADGKLTINEPIGVDGESDWSDKVERPIKTQDGQNGSLDIKRMPGSNASAGLFGWMDFSFCFMIWAMSMLVLGAFCLYTGVYKKHRHKLWKQFFAHEQYKV